MLMLCRHRRVPNVGASLSGNRGHHPFAVHLRVLYDLTRGCLGSIYLVIGPRNFQGFLYLIGIKEFLFFVNF